MNHETIVERITIRKKMQNIEYNINDNDQLDEHKSIDFT